LWQDAAVCAKIATFPITDHAMSKLEQALQAFDAYNRNDPNVFVWQGEEWPREYFFALKLHEWVLKLRPDAGEALLLAARCQHIGRWEVPRSSYPEGRIGYLTWRKDLTRYHADKAAGILREIGYDDGTIARVRTILLKQGIKQDDEVQTMENALCLVFLEYQYEDFHAKNPDKIVEILRKSLVKMDGEGHRHALQLPYSPAARASVDDAVRLLQG